MLAFFDEEFGSQDRTGGLNKIAANGFSKDALMTRGKLAEAYGDGLIDLSAFRGFENLLSCLEAGNSFEDRLSNAYKSKNVSEFRNVSDVFDRLISFEAESIRGGFEDSQEGFYQLADCLGIALKVIGQQKGYSKTLVNVLKHFVTPPKGRVMSSEFLKGLISSSSNKDRSSKSHKSDMKDVKHDLQQMVGKFLTLFGKVAFPEVFSDSSSSEGSDLSPKVVSADMESMLGFLGDLNDGGKEGIVQKEMDDARLRIDIAQRDHVEARKSSPRISRKSGSPTDSVASASSKDSSSENLREGRQRVRGMMSFVMGHDDLNFDMPYSHSSELPGLFRGTQDLVSSGIAQGDGYENASVMEASTAVKQIVRETDVMVNDDFGECLFKALMDSDVDALLDGGGFKELLSTLPIQSQLLMRDMILQVADCFHKPVAQRYTQVGSEFVLNSGADMHQTFSNGFSAGMGTTFLGIDRVDVASLGSDGLMKSGAVYKKAPVLFSKLIMHAMLDPESFSEVFPKMLSLSVLDQNAADFEGGWEDFLKQENIPEEQILTVVRESVSSPALFQKVVYPLISQKLNSVLDKIQDSSGKPAATVAFFKDIGIVSDEDLLVFGEALFDVEFEKESKNKDSFFRGTGLLGRFVSYMVQSDGRVQGEVAAVFEICKQSSNYEVVQGLLKAIQTIRDPEKLLGFIQSGSQDSLKSMWDSVEGVFTKDVVRKSPLGELFSSFIKRMPDLTGGSGFRPMDIISAFHFLRVFSSLANLPAYMDRNSIDVAKLFMKLPALIVKSPDLYRGIGISLDGISKSYR